jgi:enoyl-CoA hydratase/carnithine racemase
VPEFELSYEIERKVGRITIKRPPVNALRYRDWRELTDLLDSLPREDELAVVLATGGDRTFTAGHDVDEFLDDELNETDIERETYSSLFRAIHDVPIPTVVAVDGSCVGGGAILSSLCDLRVAHPGASFILAEINVGIIGGYGFVRRVLPEGTARYILYSGRPISGERAYELGMVNVLADDPVSAALDLGEDVASKNPDAIRAAKSVVTDADGDEPFDVYERELEHIEALREGPNAAEAARAFLEDREPDFEY